MGLSSGGSVSLAHVSVVLLATPLAFACGAPPDAAPPTTETTVRMAVVGQSLIKHDPRQYLDDPLQTVAPILGAADAVFSNLEVAIAGPGCECTPTRDGIFFHGTGPHVVDYLSDLGVTLLSLANNHAWDYGDEGIVSAIAEAERLGLTYAGTGANLSEATAPGYRNVAGLRIGMVAAATIDNPPGARATETTAGTNMLEPDDPADWDRNLAAIREAASNADFVIAYQHFQADAPPGWHERWARATIDAGADLYVSHGEPQLGGVEWYRGGLILYGLGNFIFHSRTIDYHPPEVWESAIVEVSIGADGVRDATFTPIALNEQGTEGDLFFETRGVPEVARGELGASILERLVDLSRPFGTAIEVRDGKAHWRRSAEAAQASRSMPRLNGSRRY
jgi:poly-gamma-glutamate capsule biosynthesis protein CapA/YwtB (metallophosphatase superfamily)